jgi:hypothetical protein
LYDYQTQDGSAVAFVYCDHTTRELQTTRNLIGTLLGQIIVQLPADDPIILDLQKRQENERPLDVQTILLFIERVIVSGRFTRVRFGADGLDELLPSNHGAFLDALFSFAKFPNVSFILFGRDNAGVWEQVKCSFSPPGEAYFKITGEMTVDDRRLFIRKRLEKDKEGKQFNEELQNFIFEHLAPSDST